MADRLTLVLVTHERKMLETECDSVTLPGTEGYLGILPGHAPLISTLRPGELSYTAGGRTAHLVVASGFCEISSDVVTVLADSAEHPEDVDLEAARAERAELERELLEAPAEKLETLQTRLALAEARLQVGGRR